MSEIGGEVPKISIKDKVQAAKKSWQEGNSTPARETVRFISDELSHQIEYGESSKDPLAYSLRSVVTRELLTSESLKYLLEPSVGTELGKKIKMVYVTQGENPRLNNINLLDKSSKTDPYYEFAESDTRSGIDNRRYGAEQSAVLDDIERVYNDVAAHGIRKDPDNFTAVHRGDPLSPEFEQRVKSLPFTGKLEFSSELQKPREVRVQTLRHIPPPILSKEEQTLIIEKKRRRDENARRLAEEDERKEAEDMPKIKEHLSKPGVKDVLRRFSEKFNNEPGKELVYGITSDGLVVAVRENRENDMHSDDYFKAWTLDAKLPADEIENKMISTSFSALYVSGLIDVNRAFPFGVDRPLSDEEIKQIFPAGNTQLVEFYKKTGGFNVPNRAEYPDIKPSIGGGRTVYPLDIT